MPATQVIATLVLEVLSLFPSAMSIVLTGISMFLGSFVHSSLGLGIGLIAIPVIGLFAPTLIPQAVVLAAMPLMAAMLWQEHREARLSGVTWLLAGRAAGVIPGVVILHVVSVRNLQFLVGGATVIAVLVTVFVRSSLPITPRSQFSMGVVSGVMGTATGVGGPPIAILYSGENPPLVRSATAVVMLIGSALTVTGYLMSGLIAAHDLVFAALSLAPITAGHVLGISLRRSIPAPAFKAAVLVVVVLTALTLIVRAAR